MKHELKSHLEQEFMFEFDAEITEDTDLFKAGILDSFGYISLMRHIEECYGVKFGADSLSGEIMVSLSRLADFVSTESAGTGKGR